jgi:pyruvate dehydrogenase E2 component (dihydrolipoamide acetyltransferase)
LQQLRALYAHTRHEQQPLDAVRRIIARRLSESKQTVPHFYLTADIDMEQALELRRQLNALQPQGKVSVNDLIVKAYALALRRVPQANVLWAEEALLQFAQVDLGIAVAVGEALFTPVIREADSKALAAISAEIKTLSEQARNAKLKPADYEGGTATISNLGMFGVREFSAILNPPQATILAVGALERRATEGASGAVVFRSLMSVTLSCDHRAIGGATGAKLLQELKAILQSPLQLVL